MALGGTAGAGNTGDTGDTGDPARPTALVLRALGIGDLLTAVPALRGVRRALPDARVVLAAPQALAPLVGLVGAVDAQLPVPGLGRLPWPGAGVGAGPSVAVNLHGRGPQSSRLLQALAPGRLVAFACPDAGVGGPPWREEEREVDRWCRLVHHGFGTPVDPDDLDLARPAEPSPAPGAAVVHPGAGYGSRRWPPERFAAVARGLADRGHRVVVTGGPAETELVREVATRGGLGGEAALAGALGLTQLCALVADAALVVSGDTGVAHLATAYRRPSVVLFGPAVPQVWGPPPGRERHVALWHGDRPGDPFSDLPHPALLAVSVAEVLEAGERALTAV